MTDVTNQSSVATQSLGISGNSMVKDTSTSSKVAPAVNAGSAQTMRDNANPSNETQEPASSQYLLNDPKLKEILLSDVGVECLLARLKQSVHTVREFAAYIKKMAAIETEYSVHLKKTARTVTDVFKRSDIKKGTFQNQILNVLKSTDRYGDAGNTFIDALHRIHDELMDLVRSMDRQRKTCKEAALRHEKNLVDAERECEKAKGKYDNACEELEKVRTADPSKNKLGFKGKSEEELHRRMTICEVDYQQKVDTCQRLRRELVEKLRVEDIRKLQGLTLECDNALSLQVMLFANLIETLQLNRAFVICPIKPINSPTANLAIKEMAGKIDSELDFYNYVYNIPRQRQSLNRAAVVFRKHPTLGPSSRSVSNSAHPTTHVGGHSMNNTASGMNGNINKSVNTANVPKPSAFVSSGTAKTGPVLSGSVMGSMLGSLTSGNSGNTNLGSSFSNTNGSTSSTTTTPNTGINNTASGNLHNTSSNQDDSPMVTITNSPSVLIKPVVPDSKKFTHDVPEYNPSINGLAVYGTPLEDLLDYEEGTVPRVVYQCVQAIDNFGLEVEGIYRANGNSAQITEIRREFDIDALAVDLLRPNNGVNDIHSVGSALKQYFTALPDPLLTKRYHREFINAANITNDIQRRDSIHAIINKLPDPNYTTLRYLVFHLYRVQERESVNKMSVANLGIVWGPALMDTDYQNVGEMALESRVVETILINAYAIFEAE